ncbi:NAD-dependent epimerase/dehydratase family protein [Uliginosibacterium sp. H1]|uniref:NAD-dependent epimerase/dehydratase family protein n=1 Tax=Uliginosibacterium sp. H1 TaxID=3114757 RepID=UPI002E183F1F|nr:NAD(P)-dependent oxidoreductase [Uliginosibacterium sp. H1]
MSNDQPSNEGLPRRVLLTGCSGTLGTVLRPWLRTRVDHLRISDLVPPSLALEANEEFVACELSDRDGMLRLLDGVDAVIHMGGGGNEFSADVTLQANVIGTFNLYHAALEKGVRRIVLASTNHATGYYPVGEVVSPDTPARPDSLYAVSKCFGETLSRYFFDRHGIETLAIRLGSVRPRPTFRRELMTWLSHGDFTHAVERGLVAAPLGHAIIYGVSQTDTPWWRDDDSRRIGFTPRDSAETFRAEIEAREDTHPPGHSMRVWQGGTFTEYDYRAPQTPKPRP